MLQTGELKNFLPRATGDWEQDKVRFTKIQQEIEELANLTDTDV
jgi:hypothetical protein